MSRFGVRSFSFALGLLATCLTSAGTAGEQLAGPYPAKVERVVDGDTLSVRVRVWLQHDLSVSVRLRGIDAPELRGRCDSEKLRAEAAAKALATLVAERPVTLTSIEGDKYFGRIVADVATSDGADIASLLVAGGFARAYSGGARGSWCEIGAFDAEDDLARVAE
jgi:endonuclease YncB( thermonuclease family)